MRSRNYNYEKPDYKKSCNYQKYFDNYGVQLYVYADN